MKEKLRIYLEENLIEEEPLERGFLGKLRKSFIEEDVCYDYEEIDHYIDTNKDEDTFQTKLFRYIDERQLKDSDVYNKVNIDRRLFSKIRSNKKYHPSKETVILLGIALELTEAEIEDLLRSASYSLPKNTTYDLIIRFCFQEKIYDIQKINEFLYDYDCKVLN